MYIKIKSIHITLLCARFRAILYIYMYNCMYIYKLAEVRWPPPHASWAPPCAIRAELQTGSAVEAQPSCVPRQRWATPTWANKPSASSSGEPCHDKWPATSHPLQCETFCCHTAWPSMILRGHPTTTTSPPSSSPTAFSSPFPKLYSVHQRRRPGREVESSSTPTGLSCPHTPTPEW